MYYYIIFPVKCYSVHNITFIYFVHNLICNPIFQIQLFVSNVKLTMNCDKHLSLFVYPFSSLCVYLQQDEREEEREDEEQTPAAGKEDPPNIEMEEEHRALSSSLSEDLLEKHFT